MKSMKSRLSCFENNNNNNNNNKKKKKKKKKKRKKKKKKDQKLLEIKTLKWKILELLRTKSQTCIGCH